MPFDDGQRRVDAAARGDAEGQPLAVLTNGVGELLQRVGVAEQGLVDVGEDRAVAIAGGLDGRPVHGFLARPLCQSAQLVDVGPGVGLPGVMLADAGHAIAGGLLPGFPVGQQLQQCGGDGCGVQRVRRLEEEHVDVECSGGVLVVATDPSLPRLERP